jgi:hypothetical protein
MQFNIKLSSYKENTLVFVIKLTLWRQCHVNGVKATDKSVWEYSATGQHGTFFRLALRCK